MSDRFYLFCILFFSTNVYLFGQTLADAVMFSNHNLIANPRALATGGMGSAIGGNSSADALNPASLATYEYSGVNISSPYELRNYTNTYYDNTTLSKQDGGLFVSEVSARLAFKNNDNLFFESGGNRKMVWNLAYNRVNDYTQNFTFEGNNNTISGNELDDNDNPDPTKPIYSSLIEDLIISANNLVSQNIIVDQTEGLAEELDVIQFDPAINGYDTKAKYSNVRQNVSVSQAGSKDQVSLRAGFELSPNLKVGGAVNLYFVSLQRSVDITENEYDAGSAFTSVFSNKAFSAEGEGLSFSAGLIYSVEDRLRLAIAYESEYTLDIAETFSSGLQATTSSNETKSDQTPNSSNSYDFIVPARLTLGAGLVYDFGYFSFDFQYTDYGETLFIADDFEDLNQQISEELSAAFRLALGHELRLHALKSTNLSFPLFLRVGYNFTRAPYHLTVSNSSINTFAGGVGVGLASWLRADIGVNYTNYLINYLPYSNSAVNAADIRFESLMAALGLSITF